MNWAGWLLFGYFAAMSVINATQATRPNTVTSACYANMMIGMLGMFAATQT